MTTPIELSSTVTVGRYKCTLRTTGVSGSFRCEWEPQMPPKLTKQMLRQYRTGRNLLMQRLAAAIGGDILIIETDGKAFRTTAYGTELIGDLGAAA